MADLLAPTVKIVMQRNTVDQWEVQLTGEHIPGEGVQLWEQIVAILVQGLRAAAIRAHQEQHPLILPPTVGQRVICH